MFLLASGRYIGAHPDAHHHGVSIQISINSGIKFLRNLAYENLLLAESWRESLHIYLRSFLRFWTYLWNGLDFYFDLI